jgi:hypothetical protein
VGAFLAAVDERGEPFAVGVVSIPRSDGMDGVPPELRYPVRLPAARPALIGHMEPAKGFVIDTVLDGAAVAAGLRAGDALRSAGGRAFREENDLSACVAGRFSGDLLDVEISRDDVRRTVQLSLQASGETVGDNLRSNGFPTTFEHATPVFPNECGGPLVDLDGHVLGITIARYGLQGCKAIPGAVLKKLIPELKSRRLSRIWAPRN